MAIARRIDPATVKLKVVQMEPAAIRQTGLPSKNTLTSAQKANGSRWNRFHHLSTAMSESPFFGWMVMIISHTSKCWGTMNFGEAKDSNMNDVDRIIPPRHPAKLAVNSPLRISLRQAVKRHVKLTHCFGHASIHVMQGVIQTINQSINQWISNRPIQRLISPIFVNHINQPTQGPYFGPQCRFKSAAIILYTAYYKHLDLLVNHSHW